MISPTRVMGWPGCGFLSTPAATVVSLQTAPAAGFLPSVAMGLSQVPFSTVISGCRIPFCWANKTTAAVAANRTRMLLRFTIPLQTFQSVSRSPVELIAGTPIRQIRLIRHILPEQKPEFGGLLERREVPALLKLVARLMVMLAVVFLEGFRIKIRRLAGELRRVFDGKGRNAGMREGKMIAAEIMTLLRFCIRRDRQVQPLGDRLNGGPHGGALSACHHDVLRATPWI